MYFCAFFEREGEIFACIFCAFLRGWVKFLCVFFSTQKLFLQLLFIFFVFFCRVGEGERRERNLCVFLCLQKLANSKTTANRTLRHTKT